MLQIVITLGLPISSGLFGPIFIVGAMFGRFFGEILKMIFPNSGF